MSTMYQQQARKEVVAAYAKIASDPEIRRLNETITSLRGRIGVLELVNETLRGRLNEAMKRLKEASILLEGGMR